MKTAAADDQHVEFHRFALHLYATHSYFPHQNRTLMPILAMLVDTLYLPTKGERGLCAAGTGRGHFQLFPCSRCCISYSTDPGA